MTVAVEERLLTYAHVQAYTGYSRRFLQYHVSLGTLKYTGSPGDKRFRRAEVDRWLDSLKDPKPEEPKKRGPKPKYKYQFVKR